MPYFPSQKMHHPPPHKMPPKTPCVLTPDDARVQRQAVRRAVTRCELEGASGHGCRLTSWDLRQTTVKRTRISAQSARFTLHISSELRITLPQDAHIPYITIEKRTTHGKHSDGLLTTLRCY